MEAALDYAIMRAVALVPEWLSNPSPEPSEHPDSG